jgi:hypothetical protein
LGIAPSTARTHLHRIFDKTWTRGQAELAYLINQIMPVRALSMDRRASATAEYRSGPGV